MSKLAHERQPHTLSWRVVLLAAAIALVYCLAQELAYVLPGSQRVLAAVWPAGGIGLAALLLTRRRLWPWILAAIFLAGTVSGLLSGRAVAASAALMAANIVESVACAWAISRLCRGEARFVRVREIVALGFAATLVNACTALLGAGAARLVSSAAYWDLWRTWWISDGLAILLVTPLIVTWRNLRGMFSEFRWLVVFEWVLFLAVWSWAGRLSFEVATHPLSPHPYMLIALLAWPGLRFGQRGVTLALVVLCAIVLTSRAASGGPLPWDLGDPSGRMLGLQIFMAFIAFTAMLLASAYTEARDAAHSSREGQARLQALGDHLPHGAVYQMVRQPDGSRRFLYVSAGIERLLGYTAAEMLRDPALFYRVTLDEDVPALLAAESVSAKEMRALSVVVRVRRTDGEVRWIQLSASPRRLRDGQLLWDGIQTDVTESRHAEQALNESLERYRVLIHNTEMPVVVVSVPGSRILFANDPAAEFFSCAPGELTGNRMADFWRQPPDRERFLAMLTESGRLAGFEAQFRTQNGGMRWAKIGAAVTEFGGEKAVIAVFSDITGIKLLHQKLEGEHAFLKTLIQTIPDMVWLKDPEGVFLGCNSSVERFFQAKESDIAGKKDFDFFPAPEAEGYRQRDREAIAAGAPQVSHERIVMREDGRSLLVETIRAPMRDETGRLIGVMGIARDITAARQAEAVLRERLALQEQLETTAAMLPGAIYSFRRRLDGTGCFPYASRAFEDVWGTPAADVRQDSSGLWSLIHPDDVARVRASIAESARCLTEWHQEFRIRHPKKGEIWVEGRSIPAADAEGIIWHGFQTDVSARKRTELVLAEQAIRRRILVEESKDGIAVLDRSGRLREWNRSFAAMLGYDAREMAGLSVWDWEDLKSREELLESLQQLASTPATFETRHRRKDESRYEVEVSASGAEFGGEILIFCVHRDITARRQAEQQRDFLQRELHEARRLESIEVLSGGLAHEFNNLLTVINGYATLLRGHLGSRDAALKDVAQIQKAGEQAANLTGQLLAYGRKRLMRPKSLDLNTMIQDGHHTWHGLLEPGIRVVTDLAPALKPITADPEQMAEVIAHLLRNANDAMPVGGVLTLRTGNVQIGEARAVRHRGARAGDFVMLTVSDNGVGMDENTQERIFEPFFTTKQRALASGLGLATVQGIVAQHRGWIDVESTPGEGAAFHIYLPSADTVDFPERLAVETPAEAGQAATILVVEDQEAVRNLTASILAAEGYRTIEAESGLDAIAAAARHPDPIDLLVTDVIMPGMTGPELAERLQARIPSMKVLYVSGYPHELIENHGGSVREAGFVAKPYVPDALLFKVQEILRV